MSERLKFTNPFHKERKTNTQEGFDKIPQTVLIESLLRSPNPYFVIDILTRVKNINDAGLKLLGLENEPEKILGKTGLKFVAPESFTFATELMMNMKENPADIPHSAVITINTKRGPRTIRIDNVFEFKQKTEFLVGATDITDSLYDLLCSNLLLRRRMEERVDSELAKILRKGGSISVAMFDIDDFKEVNDTYGHQTGDTVLQIVARALTPVRRFDFGGRWGGEEFVMVFPSTNENQTLKTTERLRQKIDTITVNYKGIDIKPKVSIGVASFPFCDKNLDALPPIIWMNIEKKIKENPEYYKGLQEYPLLDIILKLFSSENTDDKINTEREYFQNNRELTSFLIEIIRDTLISMADQALYESKREGKNRVTAYSQVVGEN